MLNIPKIEIYILYEGDVDSWARSGPKYQKLDMTDSDWGLIDRFIGDLTLIKNGRAAESYIKDVNIRLIENCEGQGTIDEIKKIVEINGYLREKSKSLQPRNIFGRIYRNFFKKK